MCMSTPSYATPKVEAPVSTETLDSTGSQIAGMDSERQRRLRALSRFRTMQGGAMQGSEAGTGKVKLGV